MKKPLFRGVCTALVTPFQGDHLNEAMLETLLLRQEEAGVKAVVLSGTTGESATLTKEEKLTLFRTGRKILQKDCLLIAGTGSNNTKTSVELSRAAEELGADALLVVTPYYNKATSEGLIAHYTAIADAVNIPVILYNVPSRTGVDVPLPVYRRLSEHPNICGVKEASGSLTKIARIRNECGQDFAVWSGNDDTAVAAMSLGGAGMISVLSNLCPKTAVQMAEAALSGDFAAAGAMQCRLMPLIDALFSTVNPIPIKVAMGLAGFDPGPCRLPLTDLSREQTEHLRQALELTVSSGVVEL